MDSLHSEARKKRLTNPPGGLPTPGLQLTIMHAPFKTCIRPSDPWTKEEIAMLESLATTVCRKEISKRLGRSLASIGNKAYRMKIALANGFHPKITAHKEKVAEACRLYSEGFETKEIAKIMQANPSTIYNWIAERNRPQRPTIPDDEATIIIRQALKEIAPKHGFKASEIHLVSKVCQKKLAARDEAIKLSYVRGVSKPQLVNAFLKTPQTINSVIRNTP